MCDFIAFLLAALQTGEFRWPVKVIGRNSMCDN